MRHTVQMSGWQRRVRNVVLEVGFAVLLLWAISWFQARELPRGSAPAFALRTLDGDLVDNDALRGKPTLLVFWAPWCGVCRAMSQNVSWVASLERGRAHVVSVASDYQDPAQVRTYVREHGVDYAVLLGGKNAARAFGVRSFPTLFFLDERGQIRDAVIGYTSTLGMLLRL